MPPSQASLKNLAPPFRPGQNSQSGEIARQGGAVPRRLARAIILKALSGREIPKRLVKNYHGLDKLVACVQRVCGSKDDRVILEFLARIYEVVDEGRVKESRAAAPRQALFVVQGVAPKNMTRAAVLEQPPRSLVKALGGEFEAVDE